MKKKKKKSLKEQHDECDRIRAEIARLECMDDDVWTSYIASRNSFVDALDPIKTVQPSAGSSSDPMEAWSRDCEAGRHMAIRNRLSDFYRDANIDAVCEKRRKINARIRKLKKLLSKSMPDDVKADLERARAGIDAYCNELERELARQNDENKKLYERKSVKREK